ncbi:sporulation integral membrane protein YlbJ [Caproiciproducens sp. MSJ-32]|uniref:sporulation integral membrane protein YlbJ n=1 Tax=Caproiciproducens sp. MSJ-32 TaxID=2841527 RepID=UPI001C0FCC4B|nr:sporulation integral membrane protein YlbJ [Caproiciproducens sp. MSJ-32]MBU5454033.1 sporulation integral membrane protein YlbJ [Caproiciproducens sp. MSJ-32]
MFSIYILCLFIFCLIFLLLKLLNVKKNYIISIFITFFIILFVMNLASNIKSAVDGVKLVITAIVPTIFPFSVICNLLIYYDGIELYSKLLGPLICRPLKLSNNCSFPLAASFICGYPLGAKYASEIYELNYIDKKEYERLLNIASNAGPIFILGSISIAILNNIKFGYLLLIANYLSVILIGLLTRRKSTHIKNRKIKNIFANNSFGTNLKNAVENSVATTINVGAFVIIFSVIINIIKSNTIVSIAFSRIENLFNLPSQFLYNLFLGTMEFTNGAKLIADSEISIILKLSMISAILSFSGLSVIGQVSSLTSHCKPNIKKYVFYKFLQGILSFFITFIFASIFLNSINTSSIYYSRGQILVKIYKLNGILLALLIFSLIYQILYKKHKRLHFS